MEIKVNDYVRTEKGVIGKYNIVKTGETIPNWNGGYGYKEIEKEYIDNIIYNRFDDKIIKSSPNIIDLIEVGDYVNGLPVRFIEKDRIDIGQAEDFFWLKNENITSVLTKEMFEKMEYKVGE